jgi:hypothetical protein
MCFGAEAAWLIPLLGSLASVAGTVITTNEQRANAERQAKARNDELNRVLVRNDKLADESRQSFTQRMTDVQPDQAQNDQQAAETDRAQALDSAVDRSAPTIPLAGDAPQVVKSEIAKKMQEVFAGGRAEAGRLAKLGARGDSWFNSGLQDTAAARDIGVQSNQAAGNLGMLPHLQDFAEHRAYKPISPWGAILSGIGNMAGSYGGGGYTTGGGLTR